MNKFVYLIILPVSFSPCIGISQSENADYELVTTAIHRRSSETALPVTVLNKDELQHLSRPTLGETLGMQPGINNASFGPAVGQTVIRGHQGRRVMNLSNSMPSADASGNSPDHAISIEPILAESLEVLRGPSTLLYGGGAIGGVVNVLDNRISTTKSENPVFSVEARHDSASEQNVLVARSDITAGNSIWHFDGVHRKWKDLKIPGQAILNEHPDDEADPDSINGIIANTGGETSTYTIGNTYMFEKGFAGIAFSNLDNMYGLPQGTHSHEEHEEEHEEGHEEESTFIDMKRKRVDFATQFLNPFEFIEKLDYKLSYTDYQHSEVEGDGAIGTTFSNDSWQHRLQLTHQPFLVLHGVLGLQISDELFGATGDESFIPVTDISTWGIFLVEDYHTDALTFELGLRVNGDDYSPKQASSPALSFSTSSFSGSVLWDASATATLGLSLSSSQRAPSIEELYSNYGLANQDACVIHLATASCEIGNTQLDKETSFNTDLTLNLDVEAFTATITAFHNKFTDYIFQNNTGEEVDGYSVREYVQTDATFQGIEADFQFSLNRFTQLRIFGDYILGELDNYGDVPRMPPARIGSELNYKVDQWSTYLSVLHAFDQDKPGLNELPTKGYTRWDAGIDYNLQIAGTETLLFLKARNIGNEEIRLSSSFIRNFAPEAGRSIEAGFRLQIW